MDVDVLFLLLYIYFIFLFEFGFHKDVRFFQLFGLFRSYIRIFFSTLFLKQVTEKRSILTFALYNKKFCFIHV